MQSIIGFKFFSFKVIFDVCDQNLSVAAATAWSTFPNTCAISNIPLILK